MPLVRERQFNLINFLYTIGTVILLVAALFMVLEWEYAREMFAAGLFIEIVVFIITLIDKEPEEHKYSEEIVFPPAAEAKSTTPITLKKSKKKKDDGFDDIRESLKSVNDSMQSLHHTTNNLVQTVEHIQENYEKLISRSTNHQAELELLKQKLDLTTKKLESINKT